LCHFELLLVYLTCSCHFGSFRILAFFASFYVICVTRVILHCQSFCLYLHKFAWVILYHFPLLCFASWCTIFLHFASLPHFTSFSFCLLHFIFAVFFLCVIVSFTLCIEVILSHFPSAYFIFYFFNHFYFHHNAFHNAFASLWVIPLLFKSFCIFYHHFALGQLISLLHLHHFEPFSFCQIILHIFLSFCIIIGFTFCLCGILHNFPFNSYLIYFPIFCSESHVSLFIILYFFLLFTFFMFWSFSFAWWKYISHFAFMSFCLIFLLFNFPSV